MIVVHFLAIVSSQVDSEKFKDHESVVYAKSMIGCLAKANSTIYLTTVPGIKKKHS